MKLRAWQEEALELYRVKNPADFSVTATPGAGKTTFALTIATKLLSVKAVDQLIIIVPTDHLRKQWAANSLEKGIFLDPSLPNDNRLIGEDFVGYVATYAQVASNPGVHLRRATARDKKTLVIFDEIHHAGDGLTWGEAVSLAFKSAARRLTLTGTPFRTSVTSTIPFIRYRDEGDGVKKSESDYTYGYKEALADNVVRPVTFAAYSGSTSWTDKAGETYEATLRDEDLSPTKEKKAWQAILDPRGQWIQHVIKEADGRLLNLRKFGMPDAGGLILASDQESAKKYAELVRKITKSKPTIVVSDDTKASRHIDTFSAAKDDDHRWMIAVRMVSEGVDVPRLAVGIWATNYRTPLFFAQAVGRFVRSRNPGETATVFLPAVRPLLSLAVELEEQRNHVIGRPQDEDEEITVESESTIPDDEDEEEKIRQVIEVLGSEASFDHILYNGKAILGREFTAEEQDIIGIPGLLSPEQTAYLLRKRDEEQRQRQVVQEPSTGDLAPVKVLELRKDINRMISRIALQRSLSHAGLHKKVREAVPGEATAHAPTNVLEKRKEWIEQNLL